MTEKRVFSLYEIEQFIREAGAEKVTEEAVRDLEKELERLANTITKKAIRYAEHAGRTKLIRSSDVLLTSDNDIVPLGNPAESYKKPYALSSSASTTKQNSTNIK